MKKFLAVTASLAMIFSLTAVMPAIAEDATEGGDGFTIAFCTKTITDDEFQKIIADNVCAAVEEKGGTPILLSSGDQTSVAVHASKNIPLSFAPHLCHALCIVQENCASH